MKVTKELESEIKTVLDSYWDCYLKGDLEKWSSFLPEDYGNIGTNDEEVWNSKHEIVEYTNRTIDQMMGKAELRNKVTQVFSYEPHIMAHELGDLFIKTDDEWSFYAKIRLSSLLSKTGTGWKILHQHGSYPDSKTELGEAFAFNKISKENQELRDAIKRRTAELEIKNRELEIETSLERVRAQAMAMQKSDGLAELSLELVRQVQLLGIETWFCAFNIYDNDPKGSLEWGSNGEGTFPEYRTPREGVFLKYFEAGQRGETFLLHVIGEDESQAHYDYLCSLPGVGDQLLKMKHAGIPFPKSQIDHVAFFKYGYIIFITFEEVPEAHEIFRRFAKVFEQTYTRFLDLQKAEKQSREAQVNLAVERIRARALAMFKSEEILEVVHKLKEEIMGLEIPNVAAATIQMTESDGKCRVWDLTSLKIGENGINMPLDISYRLEDTHPDFFMRKVWMNKEDYFVVIQNASEFKHTIQWLRDNNENEYANEAEEFFSTTKLDKVYHPTVLLNNGRMSLDLLGPPQPEVESILKKMAGAFDLAYKRFEDLQTAEKQTKEAQIETALERVRARSMAMHNSTELGEVALVLFDQLKSLGGELWGTGFAFCQNDSTVDEFWFANDKVIMPRLNIPNNVDPAHKQMYNGWKNNLASLSIEKGGQELKNHYDYMLTVPDVRPIFTGMLEKGISFPEWQKWHAAYFKNGYLLIITTKTYENEEIFIRFAKVFEQAYTRFQDLKIAEEQANIIREERDRLEITLNKLQATQDQLIQKEKLASLGQLTAGIAHEIKNPLNFVNNFSEVSLEMIDEAIDEARLIGEDPHALETIAILTDIKANLTRIHEHGSRADDIVKSMLMHSRGGTGSKELEDLNNVMREYVNLAYHGMRAGKHPINVEIEMQLDDTVGQVPLIAEDFSRVLLNLCNNAFDALREMGQGTRDKEEEFAAKLIVRTKRDGNKVSIEIEDNGIGIPDEIKDKILQPFFTTKKGTQGTGLGLSITHDIIKAHGGSLDVQSVPGQSIFKISLNS